MAEYSVSVRHYDSDGNFVRKYRAFGFFNKTHFLKTIELLTIPVTNRAPTWCNIMVRKDGKLISYKTLYTNQGNKG